MCLVAVAERQNSARSTWLNSGEFSYVPQNVAALILTADLTREERI
jgi:hypothetical protein